VADLDAELGLRLARLAESVPVAPWLGHVEPGPVAARRQVRMAWVTPLVAVLVVTAAAFGPGLLLGPTSILPIDRSIDLWTIELQPGMICPSARGGGLLIRHDRSGLGVSDASRTHDRAVQWPPGYSARITAGRAELVAPGGAVVAREGDRVVLGGAGGAEPDGTEYFSACGGVQVVGDPALEPDPNDAVHIVNVDGPIVEVLMDGGRVATVACGGSAALIATGVPRGLPWTLEFWTSDGEHLETLTVEGPLPWGVLIRGTAVLNGPWPMSYGPATEEPPCDEELAEGVSGTAADGPYFMELRSERAVYRESDLIQVTGTFAYVGESANAVQGFKAGFGILEPVYGITMQPAYTMECNHVTFEPGYRLVSPFRKSGGISGSDPEHDFKLAYLQDPDFRLPPGTWHLQYSAFWNEDACGSETTGLSTQIEIVVLPDR
jgi:hypothetical protein